jgi:hypothetical protein
MPCALVVSFQESVRNGWFGRSEEGQWLGRHRFG